MDLENLDNLKRLVIIGLVSDDDLMEKLVLKGGNALSLIYGITNRGSLDLDFSIEDTFDDELASTMTKIEDNLSYVFDQEGYVLFDFVYKEQPVILSDDIKSFWGGYNLDFKIINKALFNPNDVASNRNYALKSHGAASPKFKIDISKHEYVEHKIVKDVEGYTVYVYGLEMILFEKVRAICQQTKEYSKIIHSQEKAHKERARDFYDIYNILEENDINIYSEKNIELFNNIFDAKKVPLSYIKLVEEDREKHRQGFSSVTATVTRKETVKEFDFYFDFFIRMFLPFADL